MANGAYAHAPPPPTNGMYPAGPPPVYSYPNPPPPGRVTAVPSAAPSLRRSPELLSFAVLSQGGSSPAPQHLRPLQATCPHLLILLLWASSLLTTRTCPPRLQVSFRGSLTDGSMVLAGFS